MMWVPADEQGIAAPVSREKQIVERDTVQIHFWACSDKRIAENTSCRVHVRRIEALYRELESKSVVHPNALLQSKPWGSREFGIVDNDGNLITSLLR
jgi:hypothetical protein